jgi:hypothetical protein
MVHRGTATGLTPACSPRSDALRREPVLAAVTAQPPHRGLGIVQLRGILGLRCQAVVGSGHRDSVRREVHEALFTVVLLVAEGATGPRGPRQSPSNRGNLLASASHGPSCGRANGDTAPDASRSSAHPTTSSPRAAVHRLIDTRYRSSNVVTSVTDDKRIAPIQRLPLISRDQHVDR